MTPDSSMTSAVARQPRLTTRGRVGLALAFAFLIAIKMPDILLRGRFWAEEGNKFFENAWLLPWPRALLAPWGGYLNITANLAGVLAWHLPPLEWAPYVSTLLALVFQVCPAIVLLTSRIGWLDRPAAMVVALLLVATPVATEEVWLSSIGTQCHLTLCAALILACGARPGGVAAFRLVLLALAALSGPGPWLLTPLFALRASLERSWHRALQAAVLAGAVIVQATLFYSHEAGRTYAVQPLLYLNVAFTKHLLLPFLGLHLTLPIAFPLHLLALSGHPARWPAAVMGAILLAAAVVLAPDWRGEAFWLALAAALLAAIAYFGSLGGLAGMLLPPNGGRYAFAPQVLIGLALLACAATRSGMVGAVAAACVVWVLAVGLADYFVPSAASFAHGPSWRAELALHRDHPSHVVAGWPPGWSVPLPSRLAR